MSHLPCLHSGNKLITQCIVGFGNCSTSMWKVISNSLIIDFIYSNIYYRWYKCAKINQRWAEWRTCLFWACCSRPHSKTPPTPNPNPIPYPIAPWSLGLQCSVANQVQWPSWAWGVGYAARRSSLIDGTEYVAILWYGIHELFNSSPLNSAYMRQWIGWALVQIMACCLFGTKPLSNPMLGYCQLDS